MKIQKKKTNSFQVKGFILHNYHFFQNINWNWS